MNDKANTLPLDKIPQGWSLKMIGESHTGPDKYKAELCRPAVADGPVSAVGYGMTLEATLLAAIAKTEIKGPEWPDQWECDRIGRT